jgi:diguanylate cyclase (GGDEF)-like protein
MRLSILSKLFLSHFAAIVLVSGSVGTYFYRSAVDNLMEALKSRLQNSAALISRGIDTAHLHEISSAADVTTPWYQQQVDSLREFVRANPDISFVYVMRRRGDRVYFVLDSDPEQPALPGEEYPHRLPALLEGFVRPSVDEAITGDRWGYFLSGYSPLPSEDGEYLIGIDMRADEVQAKFEQIRLAGLLSLAFSLLLAILFAALLSRSFTGRIRNLSQRVCAMTPIPDGALPQVKGDELDQLSGAFEAVAEQLAVNQRQIERNQESLRAARDQLEQRVEERTAELMRTNELLRDEITERKRIEEVLHQTSLTDYLTSILNRRAMTRCLEQVVAKDQRSGCVFSVIVMDVDHFKAINDAHGHDVGDSVLIRVVDRLRHGIRPSDELGRWGGEEFLILLEDTGVGDARALAERLRHQLASVPFELPSGTAVVTGSFGVAQYRPGEGLDACLKRADEALYRAKSEGRNRVVG